jgi:4'-phosphopantetheinyl transferase
MARGEHEIPTTPTWLTAEEADRAAGLRFTKRRSEYVLRRWVCKQAVATATGMPNDLRSLARIDVANHPTGAPYVRVDGVPLAVDVSLSDRAGWAIALVGEPHGGVGCDLEIVEPRSAGFVADFLTPLEQEYVASRPDDDRDAAANLLWSAKESALKVLQTGLRRDTRSVEVTVAGLEDRDGEVSATGWARLEIRTAEGGVMPGWWRREGVFLVTIASGRPLPPPTLLLGSADLAAASPAHSWVSRPLAP